MPSRRRVFITEPSSGELQAVCAPLPPLMEARKLLEKHLLGTEKQDVTVHARGRASLAPMVLGAS